MITCCKDCDERYLGCHSACATYKKQAEKNAKMLEAKRQSRYFPQWGNHNTLQMMRRTMSAAK